MSCNYRSFHCCVSQTVYGKFQFLQISIGHRQNADTLQISPSISTPLIRRCPRQTQRFSLDERSPQSTTPYLQPVHPCYLRKMATIASHDALVSIIAASAQRFFHLKQPFRIYHGSTNSTRPIPPNFRMYWRWIPEEEQRLSNRTFPWMHSSNPP